VILRRLFVYLVGAAALILLTSGLVLLGGTILLFAFNDPSAESSRGQLAYFSAMVIAGLLVWTPAIIYSQRLARDPFERASALRRLYLYWACLVSSVAAMVAIGIALGQLLTPLIDQEAFTYLSAAQAGWAAAVLAAVWGFHFWLAWRDRAVAGEEGASATLRRWYMYVALLVGLLTMLAGMQMTLQVGWHRVVASDAFPGGFLASAVAQLVAGAVLWGVHARAIAIRHISEDRHSTLRALEGFIAVAISIGIALFGASQILYYALARALGVDNPGGAGTDVLAALSGPGSQLLVYGIAWVLIRRRLARDAGTQEAERQAGIRRLYTNLAALISLGAWAWGAALLLWTLLEQAEAPLIGVRAGDWKNSISVAVTLLVVGLAVWIAHWRHAPWAADRQSLSRKLYVWAALLGSVLAVLGGAVGMINAVLQQAFSATPRLDAQSNLDFAHYLAVILVAVGVGVYHYTVLRADGAARPAKPAVTKAPSVAAVPAAARTSPEAEVLGPHSRRYALVVTDATEDDVHQALSSLPPHASYKLTHAEQPVDGH
jgi:Domain of unknown function (DUF5671)